MMKQVTKGRSEHYHCYETDFTGHGWQEIHNLKSSTVNVVSEGRVQLIREHI